MYWLGLILGSNLHLFLEGGLSVTPASCRHLTDLTSSLVKSRSGTTLEDRSRTSKRGDDYWRDSQLRGALQVTKFHHRHRLLDLHFSAGLVPKASTQKSVQSTGVGTAQAEQAARMAGLNHSSGMLAETLFTHE